MTELALLLCGDTSKGAMCGLPDDHLGPHDPDPTDIHSFFSLSYASYLVVNRSLLQSMPEMWQYRFVALLEELQRHFANIDEPNYTVYARDDKGRFIRDPIPNYSRGRTFVKGVPDE